MIKITVTVGLLLFLGSARAGCVPSDFDRLLLMQEIRELRTTTMNIVQAVSRRSSDFGMAMRIVDASFRIQAGAQALNDLIYISTKMVNHSDRKVVDELFKERAGSYIESVSDEIRNANSKVSDITSGGVGAQAGLLIARMQSAQKFFSKCG